MFSIEKLNQNNLEQVTSLIDMHLKLLPESSPSVLGRYFMRKIYFREMVEKQLIEVDLCKYKDSYVGFNLYTKYPNDYFNRILRSSLLKTILIVFLSILSRPFNLWDSIKKINKRKAVRYPEDSVLWLTFGVLPSVLKVRNKENIRIPEALIERMVANCKKIKCKSIIGGVSKKNLLAILFYQSMGFVINKSYEHKDGYLAVNIEL